VKSAIKIFLLFFSLFPVCSLAAKTNYKNTLIGGRAALLGGAFTAIADDASAIFYNPSGISYIQGTSLSGSANVYTANGYTYEKTIGSQDWKRSSENLSPGYFGITKKSKRWAFGFGYAQTDLVKENQNEVFENVDAGAGTMNYYSLVLNTEDKHHLFGASASYFVSEKFSLGLTLSYSLRHYQRHQNQYSQYTNADTEHAFDFKEIKSKGFKPILGFMWSPADRWSVGIAVAKDLLLGQITEDVRNKLDKGSGVPVFVRQTNTGMDKTPVELSLGVALFSSPKLLFSFNLDYFKETSDQKVDVINFSFGTEYYLNPSKALRAGVFTNRSNVKEFNSSARNLDPRVHIYGASAGMGFFTANTDLTAGMIYSRGEGEIQPFTGSTASRDFTFNEIKMVLASSYDF
jgi:long-subunit fatty acid transport protein